MRGSERAGGGPAGRRGTGGLARLLLVLLLAVPLAACAGGGGQAPPAASGGSTTTTAATGTTEATAPVTTQDGGQGAACELPPLRTRIAQLVIVGFPGTAVGEGNTALVESGVGGLIVFGDNVRSRGQLSELIEGLQERAEIPLEIAVDQEPGTRVARLKGLVPATPSAKALGKLPPEEIREHAAELGRSMKELGITADFAPVLDVVSPSAPDGGIIGDRAFGTSPRVVGRAAVAFMEGLRDAGIGTVGKHFPGHGQTTVDSHEALPVVTASKGALRDRDLAPYRTSIEEGLPAVMVGHLLVRSLDPKRPTSLSEPVIGGLLRDELGFDGLVVTDALEMEAISGDRSLPVAAELALNAGADQLLLGAGWDDVDATIDRIERSVRAGRVRQERVDEAFLRVQTFKGVDIWDACG